MDNHYDPRHTVTRADAREIARLANLAAKLGAFRTPRDAQMAIHEFRADGITFGEIENDLRRYEEADDTR